MLAATLEPPEAVDPPRIEWATRLDPLDTVNVVPAEDEARRGLSRYRAGGLGHVRMRGEYVSRFSVEREVFAQGPGSVDASTVLLELAYSERPTRVLEPLRWGFPRRILENYANVSGDGRVWPLLEGDTRVLRELERSHEHFLGPVASMTQLPDLKLTDSEWRALEEGFRRLADVLNGMSRACEGMFGSRRRFHPVIPRAPTIMDIVTVGPRAISHA